jgi:hypothetical protein
MAKRKARPKKPRIDYDGIYHRLFENPAIVAELLRGFVDADLLADLELEGMQPHGTKSHTRSGRRDGDMVWRIPRRDGDDAYLVLLLEFQSTNERYMSVRLLTYAGLLWQRVIIPCGRAGGRDPSRWRAAHRGSGRFRMGRFFRSAGRGYRGAGTAAASGARAALAAPQAGHLRCVCGFGKRAAGTQRAAHRWHDTDIATNQVWRPSGPASRRSAGAGRGFSRRWSLLTGSFRGGH